MADLKIGISLIDILLDLEWINGGSVIDMVLTVLMDRESLFIIVTERERFLLNSNG